MDAFSMCPNQRVVKNLSDISALDMLENWELLLPEGVCIRGWRTAPSGKPVIHFLHGTGLCGLSYWPMLAELMQYYDIFIHDIQGHGDSDSGERFWGWNENVSKVYTVWQGFSSEYQDVPVVGVGHSFGAVVTALLADEYPDMFHHTVLLDPVLFSRLILFVMHIYRFLRLGSPNPYAAKARKRRDGWSSRQQARDYLYERGAFKGWDESALQAYVSYALCETEDKRVRLKCSPQREADIFATFPRRMWKSIANIKIDTHIIFGVGSYPFVPRSVKRLCQMNKFVSSFAVKGGHCFMQEHPRDIANLIHKFISSRLDR